MIKNRIIKIKNIENEEVIMAITMAELIIATLMIKIIIIIMVINKIKIGSCIKI